MGTRWVLGGGLVVVMLAGSGQTLARAQTSFHTGNQLLDHCRSQIMIEQTYCEGYAVGVADALGAPGGKVFGVAACLPNGVTARQVMDVTMRFLEQHPELRHLPAVPLVAEALAEAFPCR
jgi:hypothetical protein